MNDNVINFPTPKRRLVASRLKDARLASCLNQSELALAIGITRQAISSFEQGEKGPEPETLEKIAACLNQPISYFSAEDRPLFGEFSSLFFRTVGTPRKRRNMACSVVSKWFVQIANYLDRYVNFPAVRVPQVSPSSVTGRYTAEEIEEAAEQCRKHWNLGLGPIPNVLSLLEANGVTVCRCEFDREAVEAFSFWNGNRPFIVLASDKESAARSRFDAAHELGHLVLHRWIGFEELENPKTLKTIEREADRFASAFLLPRQSFPTEIFTTRLDAFISLKKRWKVSIAAMVYRCKQLEIFDEDQVTNLYKQLSARRWRTREPLDDLEAMPLEQPRLLRRAIEMLLNAGKKIVDELVTDLRLAHRIIVQLCSLPANFFASTVLEEGLPSLK
jgi:Zn-dependent peptidase ImmA (M78 family)/transcriptional regulator with XRE-family HTH domain